jgi:hypothetical protein
MITDKKLVKKWKFKVNNKMGLIKIMFHTELIIRINHLVYRLTQSLIIPCELITLNHLTIK